LRPEGELQGPQRTVRAEPVEALGAWREGFDKLSLALRQAQGEREWGADRREQPLWAERGLSILVRRITPYALEQLR
jgi:hypothetical protein